ncbi:hypothetical protein CMI47_22665 [Candidatus Pacearchaeota archaeon]|jgi:hypothetical protein|nr:hypothetical protein [Candidatus Pacearchaeota archaeon]|tara:strand:- start:264 stop:485 length:222 start_codon:yes stop_codon:yes gene_type:complete
MKEIMATVNEWITGLTTTLLNFIAVGAIVEVLFGSGVFGVSVIGNLTAIINGFGNSGFAGLLALLFLVGLYKK